MSKFIPKYTGGFLLVFLFFSASAQLNITVTLNSGNATTTCTDILGNPDPTLSVNINNTGWVIYPANGNCFSDFPNIQFNETFPCFLGVPPTIEVCLRAFDNDPNPFVNCDINEDCLVEICDNFPIPIGTGNYTLEIPDNLASDGDINFTIEVSGFPSGINDLPCDAIDLGLITELDTIGDGSVSLFNNYCGTNNNEPNPTNSGTFWNNDVGTWFQFSTGPNPSSAIQVFANSDPSDFGDLINLQLAIYESDDNTCTGNLTFLNAYHNPFNNDELVLAPCLEANSTYWVLVDGSSDSAEELNGWFGMEIVDYGTEEAPDLICDAVDMGAVPENGFVEATLQTNFCSGNSDDPPVVGFGSQHSVWYAFLPPTSGHVNIEATAYLTGDLPLDVQMAVFVSTDNSCTGKFFQVSPGLDPPGLDAAVELSCLDPALTYFIMIDGTFSDQGLFNLTVSDMGNNTPTTNQSFTLCSGESLVVDSSIYTQTGNYVDTLILPNGCDSVVNTNLVVLDELILDLTIDQPASDEGVPDGMATVPAVGGTGIYNYTWSNGLDIPNATNLVGGDTYCVTVMDSNGCEEDTCFVMPFIMDFIPDATGDLLDCFGDSDGVITLTATAGEPPYQFLWEKDDNSINGNGTIPADGELVMIDNLPAGTYSISFNDAFFDTIVWVNVLEPLPLDLGITAVQNASCFGDCNGSLTLSPSGGTPPYQLAWPAGGTGLSQNFLCAGIYEVILTDANDCVATFSFEITEPPEFTAQAEETKPISCFGGSDGEATVTTNGNPVQFQWDNGGTTQTITGLNEGTYAVTVYNNDGCTATSSVQIIAPAEPVSVVIFEDQAISCQGSADGILEATVSGPGNFFTFQWSNGDTGPLIEGLGPGTFSVTVTSDLGCTAENAITISEPPEIQADFSTIRVTCDDDFQNGGILIESVVGGMPPYDYSLDGVNYSTLQFFDELAGGAYTLYVRDSGGCVKSFNAFVEGIPNLFIELGQDLSVHLGDSIVLNGTAATDIPNLVYQWEPAEIFDCSTCPLQTIYPMETMTLEINVLDENTNCTASDFVFVDVNKIRRVYIPNAFSPNDDGINDHFRIYGGNDVSEIKSLKIFNRFGGMVFEAGNFQPGDPNIGWDGRFSGKRLNPGVYVYFAEIVFIDNEVELFRGDVTLVR